MKKRQKLKKSFGLYFWIFFICGLIGTYYEEILHIVRYFFKYREFHWARRSGLFFSPVNPVYGFGAVFILLFLGRKEEGKFKVFWKSGLLGGIVEYVLSLIQEIFTGTTSWDYHGQFLNINGRTTIPYMIFWGLAGLLLVKCLYPLIKGCLEFMSKRFYKILTIIMICVIGTDLFITWTSLARKELRDKGHQPYTFVGKLYDKYFDDDFIKKKYPNMEEKE